MHCTQSHCARAVHTVMYCTQSRGSAHGHTFLIVCTVLHCSQSHCARALHTVHYTQSYIVQCIIHSHTLHAVHTVMQCTQSHCARAVHTVVHCSIMHCTPSRCAHRYRVHAVTQYTQSRISYHPHFYRKSCSTHSAVSQYALSPIDVVHIVRQYHGALWHFALNNF